jgi:hypothetical protein
MGLGLSFRSGPVRLLASSPVASCSPEPENQTVALVAVEAWWLQRLAGR